MSKKARTLIALSILPQIVIVKILAKYPELIENYYSNGIYPFIAKCNRWVFGWLPFSIGDIFYTILGLLVLRFFILKGKLFFKTTRVFLTEVFAALSIVFFAFHFLWGMNYYRQPIYKTLNISNHYTTEELITFTKKLITKTNLAQEKLTDNDITRPVVIPYTKAEIYRKTVDGFKNTSIEGLNIQYKFPSIKTSLYSIPLTYMGYSGYLNPFTNEAQTNGLLLDFKFPLVSCHEIAHQLGYSAENEANFIGFLAAKNNPDLYFKYSAYAYILRYCLGELRNRDFSAFEELNSLINPGIISNYLQVTEFWKKYQNRAEPAFKKTYNTFLKANNQEHGIKSYSYVVALLVNFDKKNPL